MRGFVAPSGKNLVCIPAFTDIVIDGEDRTVIKLIVEAIQLLFFITKRNNGIKKCLLTPIYLNVKMNIISKE